MRGGDARPTGRLAGARGFTLMEVIVVLAVVAILASLLTPMIVNYIDDANKTQARNDTQTIAAAILTLYKDTGKWPFKAAGAGPGAKQAGDADILTSTRGTAISTADDVTAGDTWTAAALVVDAIEDQLITNAPAYPTAGKHAWRGPYLPTVNADPWGNKYYVNIGMADPAGAAKAVFVISAGPNGRLETSADQAATTDLVPQGDDIIARVK